MPYAYQIATSASQDGLEKLIAERLKPGSDWERIDARIWDLFGEQWAVMFTDLSGFSRRVAEFGIIHFLQTIFESQRILVPCIDRHDGILLKSEGDSLFVIFRSVRKALDCSLAMQRTVREYNRGRARVPGDVHAVAPGNGQAGPERTRYDERSRMATRPSSCFP
ncbi:MAG: adenylate/guanylate cyclase domain-containing protein [Candidatus Atribacteria bacterium]|nr:adenylate/guanylate cyclase domain-containing protein [Candidatus Atribacteria bacterium]